MFLPAFTYTATAEVPLVLGATPVFVDIDPRTFQMDVSHFASRVAEVRARGELRPRAVIGVDLFGQPADWPAISGIAAAEGLFTLDDCAQSFGASLRGRKLGAAADATATSFFPSKPLGAYGDGGALFTEDADRAALFRSLRTHGEGTTRYEVLRTGMNGRMDTLQAAVLLAKLSVFADELAIRTRIAAGLRLPPRQRGHHPGPRPGQRERLGDLRHSPRRRGRAGPHAGGGCGPRACRVPSTTRVRCTISRPIATRMTGRRCRCRRTSRAASSHCRSIRI